MSTISFWPVWMINSMIESHHRPRETKQHHRFEKLRSQGNGFWKQKQLAIVFHHPWRSPTRFVFYMFAIEAPRILLHSCSGGPDDWIPIIHRLNVPFRNEIRFVVPCAPLRRESHNAWKGEMNSWFEYSEDGEHAKAPCSFLGAFPKICLAAEDG